MRVAIEQSLQVRTIEGRLEKQEKRLKLYYQDKPAKNDQKQASALSESVRLLELHAVLGLITESIVSLQLKTVGELSAQSQSIAESIRARTNLDLEKVLKENQTLLGTPQAPQPANELLNVSLLFWERRISSLLSVLLLEGAERLAKKLSLPKEWQRFKHAHQILESFVNRHQPKLDHQILILGPVYAEGRISLEEIGQVLGLPVWDVIPELERRGFHRSLDGLILTDVAFQMRPGP